MRIQGKQVRHVEKLLSVSNNIAFKIWLRSTPLKILAGVIGIALALLIILAFIYYRHIPILQTVTLGAIGLSLLTFILTQVATMLFGKNFMRVVQFRSTLIRILIGIVMAALGCWLARLHLHIFDRMFLRRGSLDNFKAAGKSSE